MGFCAGFMILNTFCTSVYSFERHPKLAHVYSAMSLSNVFIGLRKADCTDDIRCDDLIFNFIEEIRPEHLIYEWVIF